MTFEENFDANSYEFAVVNDGHIRNNRPPSGPALVFPKIAEETILQAFIKRSYDLILAMLIGVALLPVMICVGFFIKMHDGDSPFFIQKRIGKNGKIFGCIKFRTMVKDAQVKLDAILTNDPVAAIEWAKDQKLRNDPRITGVGKLSLIHI